MKRKIIIVTYTFPPFNSISGRRWAQMIPILSTKYDVYVFTQKCYGDLIPPLPEDKIKRVGQLKEKFSGVNNSSGKLIYTFAKYLRRNLRTLDSTSISFYLKNRLEFLNFFNKVKPDILITSIGPFSCAYFGYELKIRKGSSFKWIVDIRDGMSLLTKSKKNLLKKVIDEKIDKSILCRTDKIITVSKTLASILSDFYEKEVIVIYNGFEENQFPNIMPKKNTNFKIIYYAGRIYDHRIDSLKLLFNALKNNSRYKIVIRLLGDKQTYLSFEKLIGDLDLRNVELREPAEALQIEKEERSADVLLVIEDLKKNNPLSKGTLTGKLFEYLPFNAPILSICRNDSEIGDILSETNRGVVVSTAEEIINTLNNAQFYELPKVNLYKFSRTSQAKILINLIK